MSNVRTYSYIRKFLTKDGEVREYISTQKHASKATKLNVLSPEEVVSIKQDIANIMLRDPRLTQAQIYDTIKQKYTNIKKWRVQKLAGEVRAELKLKRPDANIYRQRQCSPPTYICPETTSASEGT